MNLTTAYRAHEKLEGYVQEIGDALSGLENAEDDEERQYRSDDLEDALANARDELDKIGGEAGL